MHQSRHLAAVFGLDRHHKTAVTDGDDRILQQFLIGGGADHFVQLFPDAGGRRPHFAADVRKSRGGGVGDLFLRQDRGVDALLQIFIRREHRKTVVQAGGNPLAVRAPFGERADHPQRLRDIQQLAQRQGSPRRRTAQGVGGVFQLGKGGRAETCHQLIGVAGFLHQPFGLRQVIRRLQLPCKLGCILAAGLPGQHFQNLIQFQRTIISIHSDVSSFSMYRKNSPRRTAYGLPRSAVAGRTRPWCVPEIIKRKLIIIYVKIFIAYDKNPGS